MICRTKQAVSFQNKLLYNWIIFKDEMMCTLLLKLLCCKSEVHILAKDWLLKMKQMLQCNPSRQLSMLTLQPLKLKNLLLSEAVTLSEDNMEMI